MRDRKPTPRQQFRFALVTGAVFLVAALVLFGLGHHHMIRWSYTDGVVTDTKWVTQGGEQHRYRVAIVSYRFSTAGGQEVIAQTDIHESYNLDIKPGQPIGVYFDPASNESITVHGYSNLNLYATLCLFMALFGAAIAGHRWWKCLR